MITRRNDLKTDIFLLARVNSAKLIVTMTISKTFHLFSRYFTGVNAIIFKRASAVNIPVNIYLF